MNNDKYQRDLVKNFGGLVMQNSMTSDMSRLLRERERFTRKRNMIRNLYEHMSTSAALQNIKDKYFASKLHCFKRCTTLLGFLKSMVSQQSIIASFIMKPAKLNTSVH